MKKGLVLEGGGVKGAYQIGAYYAFKNCKIYLDGFVGTSIGSFNAAMLASNKAVELLDFWYNVSPGEIFGFDYRFIDLFNDGNFSLESLKGAFNTLKLVVKNLGLDNSKMEEQLGRLLKIEELKNSDKDFGLVTVKVNGLKNLYVYKEEINTQKELVEYILASCYLPIFKERKILDGSYYVDGGFYDNSPTKMLADKDYNVIYVIGINGIGFKRKNDFDNVSIVEISPSRPNGSILELNIDIIRDNIKMGYYDALRKIKHLDGYKYCFKRRSNNYYNFLVRKVPSRLLQRVKGFFGVESNKSVVIKAIEYLLEKEDVSYYNVYDSYKVMKKYRKRECPNFIYKFINYIRFF